MGTKALDVATLFHALDTLEKNSLGPNRKWDLTNKEQKRIFSLYSEYKKIIPLINNLKAKVSTDWKVLNNFLQSENFDPMFDKPFDGLGVVSIIDKLIKWIGGTAEIMTINSDGKNFPGFEIPKEGVEIVQVHGYNEPLAILKTSSENKLYLMMVDEPNLSALDIVEMAFSIMQVKKSGSTLKGAIIPKIDFNIKPDISFLCGANTLDKNNEYWFIAQAMQQFKFRMNEEGARGKVATGIEADRGDDSMEQPQELIFDNPFIGWFIQGDIPVPIAVFYADKNSWKEPEGGLNDL